MKHTTHIIHVCFTIIFALPVLALSANWRSLPIRSQQEFDQGLAGGEAEQHPHSLTRCLNHPEYIYLSHDVGGAWRSADAGETWQKCLDKNLYLPFGQSIMVDPNDPDIVFIIVDNSYNYLAQDFEGLYRSHDGGESWEFVLHTDVNYNSGQHRIYRHNIHYDVTSCRGESPASRWYAAFPNNGLFRSEDGGAIWKKASSLAGHAIVYGVYCHPTDSMTVYVGTDKGFYVSQNRGENVQPASDLPAAPVSSIAIHPQHPGTLYVTIRNDGLYHSENGGASFVKIKEHPAARVVLNPGFPDKMYLIGLNQNSIYSDDAGATWTNFGSVTTFPGLGRETGWRRWIDGDLSGLVPNPHNKNEAVAFSRSTLFKTTDGGIGFVETATGYTGNAWSWWNGAVAFDRLDGERFAFFNNDVGMRITLHGGDYFEPNTNPNAWTWYQAGLIGWLGTYSGDFQPLPGSKVIVASVGDYFVTQLMRTTNNGKSWTLVTQGANQEDMNLFVSFHPNDPDYVYAGNKISTDAGKTFTAINFPSPYQSSTLVGMCRNVPDVVFAMDGDRRTILRSPDRGVSWEVYARPGWRFIRLDNLPTFAADPFDPDKVYTLDANYDLAAFDGSDWKSLNVLELAGGHSSANFVRTVTVDPNVQGILYAGMFENGIPCIFRSMDDGESWQDITENLPRNGMSAMAVNPHTGELYKGSCIGTWVYPAPYEAKVGRAVVSPDTVQLGVNYPNPSNPGTTIPFNLLKAGRVKIVVYSTLGQKIVTLLDETRTPGHYEIVWNGTNETGQRVANGLYLVHMMTEGALFTRKAVLVQ
ncbi:T9SS C-terminal target domain-containing protein [candidate division KSB1 bacterium]|nr:T9SS type A sorting domain-containing protein [candidate division KSB1 bacterium]RQW02854.1 MAG: T9SS C-terminal target domain-containing protein [candidate division KSB1 bacterium]